MGDMELEFEKYCVVDGSPTTVLPSPCKFSIVEKRKAERKPNWGNDLLNQNEDFKDISSCIYQSTSCKSNTNEVLKRGSVYQSSKELSKTKKIGTIEGIKRIELLRSGGPAFSFGIVGSYSSDEDSSLVEFDRSSVTSLNLEPNASFSNPKIETCSPDFLDLSFPSVSERISGLSSNGFLEISLDSNDGNGLSSFPLLKSLSDKLAHPHSPCQSESNWSKSSSSPKTHFGPVKEMFNPFVTNSKTLQKSLLCDFSNTWIAECDSRVLNKECRTSLVPHSPAHLHGLLKTGNKRGVPFFEFSVKLTEEIFMAKTWKVGNALNWAYTFHKKRSNASGWGFKDSNKESCTVAQMQVSSYLCTELNDNGAFDNSMVTEFVLYDIAQARKNIGDFRENLKAQTCELNDVSNQTKLNPQPNLSTSHLWPQGDLNPSLEIGAIVLKVPSEKRESLKCKNDELLLDLVDYYGIDKRKKDFSNFSSPAKVNVITPLGSHSLPNTESCGPSPLLDRWRLGGGCDCGGWDMGCPLLVSGNSNIRYSEEHLLVENQQPLELFIQGTKEETPILTMSVTNEGQYTVDFHAQLTTLQAFSICVAILHSMETTTSVEQEREKQVSHCDSLRVFMGEEVKCLIEAVTEEEEKTNLNRKIEEKAPPSFVLNPPFSPIARA
ncbi:hypothetical protein LguiA_034296 [Lonicera macranthoides]